MIGARCGLATSYSVVWQFDAARKPCNLRRKVIRARRKLRSSNLADYKLKDRYTKDEAHKAKGAVERKVRKGSLEVMQGAAYKAHITKRTGRR